MDEFQFRECEWQACRFRFPVQVDEAQRTRCPQCGSATRAVGVPITAEAAPAQPANPPFSALLDNIRSIHNVGSMFRTADGAGLRHLYLSGMTATPAHPKLGKAALGAQSKVPWSYEENGVDLTQSLLGQGYELWAIEAGAGAEPFFSADLSLDSQKIVVVFGNERAGVDPDIVALCRRTLSLPMSGEKRSLNVAVAFGIVSYHLRYEQPADQADRH